MRYPTWAVALILAMTFAALLIVLPSALPPSARDALSKVWPSWLPMKTITLGLDLQGGSEVLLEVDAPEVVRVQVHNLRDDVTRILREENVQKVGGVGVQPHGVQVRLANPADAQKVLQKFRALGQPTASGYIGGSGASSLSVTASDDGFIQTTITEAGLNDRIRRIVDQTIEVLRRRIDESGMKEPSIQREGDDRILVQVPGLQDPQILRDLLNVKGILEFHLVAQPGADPNETEEVDQFDGGKILIEKQTMVRGEDLTDAQPGFDSHSGEPIVNFRFNLRGGQKFAEVTTHNVGRPFAILLDQGEKNGGKKVYSAPIIRTPITGGSGQISGHFSVEEANKLSVLLRAGALPVNVTTVEERTVGPGLGQDSINAGKRAAYVGAALVVTYMILTYGIFGVFASIALFVHILLIFAALILMGATLTLPGIAGIVLTIGMAVDSNVLIYERIREENHMGRSILSSLDAGFTRAFGTIVDSNVTMLVAATILYFLGAGPVRGFAVSLGLGVLTTIVTAVTMTRMMIAVWYRYTRPTKLPI